MKIIFIVNDLGVNEPFGPMILSSILKEKGHQTTLGVLKKENVLKKILSWKPDVIAYSMMSVDMQDMKKFNDSLREKKKIFTILGGPHATLDTSCINDPDIDAICVGEGEGPLLDVVECLERGKNIEGIPNIMTSAQSSLTIRNLIENVDAIPFMDRELVYSYKEMARFGIKGIWSSRGCIFPCPYCFNNQINQIMKHKGRIIRKRSVDSIIKETRELIGKYRVEFIRIQDDVFVHRADNWLVEFSEKWSSEIGKPFYCLLRSELITDEMAHYLKQAGCFSICMSIEAGNDLVRNKMLRRKIDNEKLEKAFRILKRHKINVYANSMLALPFTTIQYDIDTVDFAIKVQPNMPNFSIFMPYSGTDLGDYCKDVGIYDPDNNAISYGMRNMSPLTCFSQKEKEAQYNLCELAIVAVKFPRLRNLIVNHLIYWRPNKLFFFIHYSFAVLSYGREIFYFRHSFWEYLELIYRTLKHYSYDFLSDKKGALKNNKDYGVGSKRFGITDRIGELNKCMEAMSASNLYTLRNKVFPPTSDASDIARSCSPKKVGMKHDAQSKTS